MTLANLEVVLYINVQRVYITWLLTVHVYVLEK